MLKFRLRYDIASLVAINAMIYSLTAVYYSFMQIYLAKTHTAVEVGSLLSFGQAVATAAPVLWGLRADKAKYKNNVLAAVVFGSAVFFTVIAFGGSMWWLAFALGGTMFFLSGFGGLTDTISLEYSSANGIKYGHVRLFGTIAYGMIAFVLSLFIKKNIDLIFYIFALIAVLLTAVLIASPKVAGHARKNEKFSLKPVLCDSRLMFMFALMGIGHFAWGYYLNFFPTYLTNELNAPDFVWGLNVMFTVMGEIPFFLMFNRLFDRYGIKKIFTAAILLTVLRYALLAVFTGYFFILITGAVTGFGISLYGYCCAVYINENVAPELKASAQTLMYSLAVGIPRILSGVAGGYMTVGLGTQNSLLILSGLAAVSLIVFFIKFRPAGKKSERLLQIENERGGCL